MRRMLASSLALLASFVPGCGTPAQVAVVHQAMAEPAAGALRSTLARLGGRAPGAVLRVASPSRGTWMGTTGRADLAGDVPMPADGVVRIGSVTKTFVTVLVLQAVQEGRWQLDGPVGPTLPEGYAGRLPHLDRITFRQVLDHTSGLANYTLDGEVQAESVRNPSRVWPVDELLAVAARRGPAFEPGQGVAYSNTGFLLLGLALERAYGKPWHQLVQERIAAPLGLTRTFLPANDQPPGTVRGYGLSFLGLPRSDQSILHPSLTGAAGGLASTVDEVGAFFQALFEGKLVAAAQLDAMRTVVPATRPQYHFGLGLEAHDTKVGRLFGKNGEINGFSTTSMQLPDGTLVTASANEGPRGLSLELVLAAAEALGADDGAR